MDNPLPHFLLTICLSCFAAADPVSDGEIGTVSAADGEGGRWEMEK